MARPRATSARTRTRGSAWSREWHQHNLMHHSVVLITQFEVDCCISLASYRFYSNHSPGCGRFNVVVPWSTRKLWDWQRLKCMLEHNSIRPLQFLTPRLTITVWPHKPQIDKLVAIDNTASAFTPPCTPSRPDRLSLWTLATFRCREPRSDTRREAKVGGTDVLETILCLCL